jgi:hypothetical protein
LHEKQDAIRKQLADGVLPWTNGAPTHDVDVYTIVQGCWNPIPELRPQAAYIAQRLLDLFARRSVTDELSPVAEVLEEVKNSVFQKIEAKRNRNPTDAVPSDHASMLHDAVTTRNDPVSSSLLGAAIWWELVPMDIYSTQSAAYIGQALPPKGGSSSFCSISSTLLILYSVHLVKRARVALPFLENALDGGSNLSSREAAFAYYELGKHSGSLVERR